jgi:hypothetical protein
MLKKIITDRLSGSGGSSDKGSNNGRPRGAGGGSMDVDGDADNTSAPMMALLGLRNMDVEEQEQISSLGGASGPGGDQVRSLASSVAKTSAAASSSGLDLLTMNSHGDTKAGHGTLFHFFTCPSLFLLTA